MTIEMEIAGSTDVTTVQDTTTGIQVTAAMGGGTTGMAEADTDETAGRGRDHRGGRNLGIGITEDGDGLRRERGVMVTRTSDDGQTTEQST